MATDSVTQRPGRYNCNIILKANGSNYMPWKTAMMFLIQTEESAYEAITGKIEQPIIPKGTTPTEDQKKKLEKWRKANQLAHLFITNSIEPTIIQAIYRDEDTTTMSAESVWRMIQNYCTTNSGGSIQVAFDSLISYKYNSDDKPEANIARFRAIVDTIKMAGTELPDGIITSALLKGLPSSWDSFKQSITAQVLISSRSVIELVIAEALRRQAINGRNDQATALFSRMSIGKKRFDRGRNMTKRYNHRTTTQNGRTGPDGARKDVQCFRCGKIGHYQSNCRSNATQAKNKRKPEAHNAETLEILLADGLGESCSEWIIDSGCTNHISKDLNNFVEYRPYQISERRMIKIGGNQWLAAHGIGTVILYTESGQCTLHGVLYTPRMRRNLVSISRIMDDNWEVSCDPAVITIRKGDVTIEAKRDGHLYCLQTFRHSEAEAQIAEQPATLQQFHEIFGHLGKQRVREMLSRLQIQFAPDEDETCEPCIRGKQTRASYRSRPTSAIAHEIGHVSTDLCSPSETSIGGHKHLMCVNDEYSKFRRAYYLKHKSEAATCI